MKVAKYFCRVYGRGSENTIEPMSLFSTPAAASACAARRLRISASSTCSGSSSVLWWRPTGTAAAPIKATLRAMSFGLDVGQAHHFRPARHFAGDQGAQRRRRARCGEHAEAPEALLYVGLLQCLGYSLVQPRDHACRGADGGQQAEPDP